MERRKEGNEGLSEEELEEIVEDLENGEDEEERHDDD
jgi:hypothetical protein